MTENLYINYSEFNPSRLIKTNAISNTVPHSSPQITYYTLPILYNYDVVDKNNVHHDVQAPLAIETPILKATQGIIINKFTDSKSSNKPNSYSMLTVFDINNPEIAKFVSQEGFWKTLYDHYLERMWEIKNVIKYQQKKEFLKGSFTYPIFIPKNTETNEDSKEKNPSKFFQLINDTKRNRKTIFRIPILDEETNDFKKVDWDMLKNTNIEFQPIIAFSHIYIGGGKMSFQMKITEAVVTSIKSSYSESSQKKVLNELSKNQEIISKLTQQLSILSKEKKEETKEVDDDELDNLIDESP